MREELAELPRLLTAHLGLTLFPLLAGTMLSIPLGVLSSRFRRLEHLSLNVAAVIQTVPSLALLALMVPLLGAIGATSIGYLPAFVALTLYSVLPVLRNTVTGLTGVNPALIEAARGVGMSPRERLLHVELPVAMPLVARSPSETMPTRRLRRSSTGRRRTWRSPMLRSTSSMVSSS